jgi:methyl-accepting chemotaxis protein
MILNETRGAVTTMNSRMTQVKTGVETTTLAGSALHEIIPEGEHVSEMITHIAAAATQQSAATQEITRRSRGSQAAESALDFHTPSRSALQNPQGSTSV